MTAEELIRHLKLEPHPKEGGWFRETYRSDESATGLASRYPGPRSVGTCIYYLLTPTTVSALHRLKSDEIFHFYLGDPVRMLQLWPGGEARTVAIGNDLTRGQSPQVLAPRGVWQGSRLEPGGTFAAPWAAAWRRASITPTTTMAIGGSSWRRIPWWRRRSKS